MFPLILAAAAAVVTPFAAAPSAPLTKGYEVRLTASGLVCLRPTTRSQGLRLDIPLNQQVCRSVTDWQDNGLRFHRIGNRA